uniref:BZIP domain-containing protein n=1 Tax=Echinostoma caproni TaxID=27848 RepID=A0A183ADN0_9TREM
LKNEVAELRAEVARWRRIAKQKKAKDKQSANIQMSSTLELEKEIEELKQKLLDTEELRQAELTALRDAHTEQVNNLVVRLRETESEMSLLREQLQEVETQKEIAQASTPNVTPEAHMDLPLGPGPDRGVRKKQRSLKKRKQKLSVHPSDLKTQMSLVYTPQSFAIRAGSSSGAIPTLLNWMRTAVSSLPSGPPKDVTFASSYPDKSFTELFLTFLEQEAGLRAPLKLSMDHYTPESVRPAASRRPSQPDSELEDPQSHNWSHHSALLTSTAPIPMRVPDAILSQSSSNRDSKAPLNPLFQM